MRIPRIGGSDRQEGSGYTLMNEELLEYQGLHGMRPLCHLLIYRSGSKPVVCVAGNFDGGLGTSTTTAIEIIATALATRIGQEDFRLIEWYPHHRGQPPFSEVTLAPVEPTKLVHGEVVAADNLRRPHHPAPLRRHPLRKSPVGAATRGRPRKAVRRGANSRPAIVRRHARRLHRRAAVR